MFMIFLSAPIEAPTLEITDMFDFYNISLRWNEISKAGARGEVLGYRIQYWLSELNAVPTVKAVAYHIDVFEPNRSVILKDLKPFGRYGIRILAFTEGGYGVWSYPKYGGMKNYFLIVYKVRTDVEVNGRS